MAEILPSPTDPSLFLWALGPAALVLACSGADSPRPAAETPPPHVASASGEPDEVKVEKATVPESLSFESSTALLVTPGATQELRLQVTPPDVYQVRFTLLGDSLDAFLDQSEVRTGEDGVAEVKLTAPNRANSTRFSVRASVGDDLSTEQVILVESQGFATIEAQPEYQGSRPVTWWKAQIYPGITCADLGSPPPTTELREQSTGSPVVTGVPAGGVAAVLLEGERKISGCAETPELVGDATVVVKVPVSDLPIRFEGTELRLELEFERLAPSFRELLLDRATRAVTAATEGATNDVVVLLDAMANQVDPGDREAFENDRVFGSWEATIRSKIGWDSSAQFIELALLQWVEQGVALLDEEPTVTAQLIQEEGTAWLHPIALSGLEAGFSGREKATLAIEPADRIALGAEGLAWSPRELVSRATEQRAIEGLLGTASLAEALAQTVGCTVIAETMYLSSSRGFACDQTCLVDLCQSGLQAVWERVATEMGDDLGGFNLSATATVSVNEDAEPVSFSGEWIGKLYLDPADPAAPYAEAKGSVSAERVSEPTR